MLCFEQILEEALHKTAQSLQDQQDMLDTAGEVRINGILFGILTHGPASLGSPARSYIHQLCVDTGYS